MRTPTSRRALRLASTLVAAGLSLTAAPHALAADDGAQARKLTSAQAQKLTAHMMPDVYGDNAAPAGTDTTPKDGKAAGGASTGTPSTGGKGSGAAAPATDPATPVTFTDTSTLEGVRGMGASVDAGGGKYFTVHSLGTVQLHKADGTTVWQRGSAELYEDWQAKPVRPWQTEPNPVRILMGYNAISPFAPFSDQGYSTGDLTGDGVPDLVFSGFVGDKPYRPITSPGSPLPVGTFVTVLDGRSGKTLWSKLYSYVSNVKIVGDTLVTANSPRQNINSDAAETATLTGTRFSYADGALTPASTWTYDTKETADVTWGAIEDLGDGRVAAVWDRLRTGTAPAAGRTVALDTQDGSVAWQTDTALYGRQLHLDAARGRLVALEQSDSSDEVRYEIASYDLASGARTTLDSRSNALPTAMTIGDAATGGGTEYAVSESTLDADNYLNSTTIRVLDGKDPSTTKWSYTTKRSAGNSADVASTWGLDTVGGRLVATSQDDRDMSAADNPGGSHYGTLTVLNGKGKLVWRTNGTTASPMFQQPYRSGGTDHVRVVDQEQNIREYQLANGKQTSLTPLQGDLGSSATADLDGDGKQDVVVGGTSRGVWAYSGTSLLKGKPKPLWKVTAAGAVHDIKTGDVNGDGKQDVVVAADSAVTVINGRNGKVLRTIDAAGKAGQFVRSVTVADVDDDGVAEIVVPTDALRAYRADGSTLWTYAAPKKAGDVVFSDATTAYGRVYAQYSSVNSLELDAPVVNGVALDGGTGTVSWNADPEVPPASTDGKLDAALLDHAVYASPDIPFADGHAVVNTWVTTAATVVNGVDSTPTLHTVIEIRDGRTGKVLQTTLGGSPWTHGNYFTGEGDGRLIETGYGSLRTWYPDGRTESHSTTAGIRMMQFISGPGGRKLLAGNDDGGLGAYDPAMLTDDDISFASALGSATLTGGSGYLAADLDGDGNDEMISLNHDDAGVDRSAQLLGSRVLQTDQGIHQMTTFKLS